MGRTVGTKGSHGCRQGIGKLSFNMYLLLCIDFVKTFFDDSGKLVEVMQSTFIILKYHVGQHVCYMSAVHQSLSAMSGNFSILSLTVKPLKKEREKTVVQEMDGHNTNIHECEMSVNKTNIGKQEVKEILLHFNCFKM